MNYKHGYARVGQVARLHSIWRGIKKRCSTTIKNVRQDYAGRGITFCPEWKEFEVFKNWAEANGYSDDLSIERTDVDGNYCPSNCSWVSAKTQARNRRTTKYIEAFGITQSLASWAEDTGINYGKLNTRLKLGWSADAALSLP